MASNISQDKFFNIQSNPNLDAADTGVDSSGKILSKEERKAIFRRRRINPKKVFGGSGAIVKVVLLMIKEIMILQQNIL